jgi:uncharacterized RDD family membrane protein YckC
MASDVAKASSTRSYTAQPNRPAGADRPRLYLASFEGRVAAALLDGVVLFIIASLMVTVGSLIILISSDFERVDPSPSALVAFWASVVSIPVWQVLYLYLSWAWRGQTVGSAVMQIAVVRSDGRPLGLLGALARVIGVLAYVVILAAAGIGAALVRNVTWQAGAVIGAGMFLVAVGLALAAIDRYRRTLHDRLAGTIVVRAG